MDPQPVAVGIHREFDFMNHMNPDAEVKRSQVPDGQILSDGVSGANRLEWERAT